MTKMSKKICVYALSLAMSVSAFFGATSLFSARAQASIAETTGVTVVDTQTGVTKPDRVIMNSAGDYTQETTLNSVVKSIEGTTAMGGGVTNFGFPDLRWGTVSTSDEQISYIQGTPDDDTAIVQFFNGWGFTVSPVVTFNNPVSRSTIDGITFRIAAHLSSGETYGIIGGNPPHGGTGLYFYAPDSDGSKGEGILLPYDITQDEWVDYTITGADLDKFADENGMISGFYVAMGCISENSAVLYSYAGANFGSAAYLLLDSVKYNNKQTVTYYDGTTVLDTKELYTGQAAFYVPEKEGSAFLGWSVNQADGRLLGIQEEYSLDITSLYANWATAGDLKSVSGLYRTSDNRTVSVYKDGSVSFDEAFGDILYYTYADGAIYAYAKDCRCRIDLSALTKVDSVEITYLTGEYGEELFEKVLIPTGDTASNLVNDESSFEFWSDELNGRRYDFTKALTEDTTLYAVSRYDATETKIITGNNDFKMGPNWLLTSIAGVTSMNSGTAIMANPTFDFKFNIHNLNVSGYEKWAGSDDGKAFSMLIGPWGFSSGKPVLFNTPIYVDNYDSITFRIYAHLSPKSPYGGELWGGTGVRIFGAHSNGSDSGVLIPLDIQQDEWVDLTVGKDLMKVLAAEDGYMYGFTIGAAIVVDTSVEMGKDRWHTHFDWNSQDIHKSTYVLVDYITVSSDKTMSYIDGDEVLYQQSFLAGEKVDKSFVPEKAGKVFTGWTAYEANLDYSECFYQSVNLYANWVDAADMSTINGLYKKGSEELRIYKSGKIEIKGVENILSSGLGVDGILYVTTLNGVYKYNLADYTKMSSYEVTLDAGDGNVATYLVKSGATFSVDLSNPGYVVDKVLVKGTNTQFVLGTTAVTSDLELVVVWAYDEIDDYTEILGNYYCQSTKVLLELKEDNVAVYDGTTYTDRVLTSDEIIIDGLGSATYNGMYIAFDGNYVRLGAFIVTFDTGRGNAKIDPQTYDGDTYVVTKPADPVREGYTFVCWLTADGEVFDFDTVVTGSIHLFAKWEIGRASCRERVCEAV